MNKGKPYTDHTPLVPVINKCTPESVKNTLYHWHMYKGDRFLAWENGKFGRYYRDENGIPYFDSNFYTEEELGEITTFEAEEANIIENEQRAKEKLHSNS